jgi:hypothetical protein
MKLKCIVAAILGLLLGSLHQSHAMTAPQMALHKKKIVQFLQTDPQTWQQNQLHEIEELIKKFETLKLERSSIKSFKRALQYKLQFAHRIPQTAAANTSSVSQQKTAKEQSQFKTGFETAAASSQALPLNRAGMSATQIRFN